MFPNNFLLPDDLAWSTSDRLPTATCCDRSACLGVVQLNIRKLLNVRRTKLRGRLNELAMQESDMKVAYKVAGRAEPNPSLDERGGRLISLCYTQMIFVNTHPHTRVVRLEQLQGRRVCISVCI